jgi:hypothetical protein
MAETAGEVVATQAQTLVKPLLVRVRPKTSAYTILQLLGDGKCHHGREVVAEAMKYITAHRAVTFSERMHYGGEEHRRQINIGRHKLVNKDINRLKRTGKIEKCKLRGKHPDDERYYHLAGVKCQGHK